MLMLAYTHTESKEVSGLPGSDPISTGQGLNTIEMCIRDSFQTGEAGYFAER